MLGSLAAALVAQGLFDRDSWATGLVLGALSAVVFAWASLPLALHTQTEAPGVAARPLRPWLVLGGSGLALVGYLLLGPNRFTAAGTVAWLLGIVLCAAALWDGAAPGAGLVAGLGRLRRGEIMLRWEWLVLAAIMLLAAFLRFYQLADLPGEAGPDIPLKLEIVRGILEGERPIWSTVYPGRETLFFYVVAGYSVFYGADQFALKLVSALFSLATIPLAYVLGTRWFGRGAGLWLAVLLALAPWHLQISRIGYRGVLIPLMVVLTLLVLDRALQRGARRDFVLLGLVAGVGVYTYTAYQVVPPALALVWAGTVAPALLARPQTGQEWRVALQPRWLIVVLLLGLLLLPLVKFAISDFESFFLRAGSRVTSQEVLLPEDMTARLLENAGRSLGMFNLRGDEATVQNVPGRRMLGFYSGALLLLGVGVALARIRVRPFGLTLLFLLVMQLPSALALAFPNEVPGAVRGGGALVPAYLLIALPPLLLWKAGRQSWRGYLLLGSPERPWRLSLRALSGGGLALLLALFLAGEARESYRRYFDEYRLAQPFQNYPLTREIARAIDDYAGEGSAFMPVYAYWSDGNAIRAQLHRMPVERYSEVPPEQFGAPLFATVDEHALFLLRPDDTQNLAALRAAFPRGALVARRDPQGNLMFYTFYAER